MSHGDEMKWQMPGWRIEQKFSPGVLVGNWAEERNQYTRGPYNANSTQRVDYQNYSFSRPDVLIRRKAQMQGRGLDKEYFFYHHGDTHMDNMITWYDEHYNKRPRDGPNKLPALRHWDGHKLAWRPETTDHPIKGAPTSYGKIDRMKSMWASERAADVCGDFTTTYGTAFFPHAFADMTHTRYSTPKSHSTKLHKYNHMNKNLQLKNEKEIMTPDVLPNIETDPKWEVSNDYCARNNVGTLLNADA